MYACVCMAHTYTCVQIANRHTCVCIANTSAGNATFCADSRAGFVAHGIVIPNCIVKALRQFCNTNSYFTNVEWIALSLFFNCNLKQCHCIHSDCKLTLTLYYLTQFYIRYTANLTVTLCKFENTNSIQIWFHTQTWYLSNLLHKHIFQHLEIYLKKTRKLQHF